MKSYKIYTVIGLYFLALTSCETTKTEENTTDLETSNVVISQDEIENGTVQLGAVSKQPMQQWVSARGYVDVPPASKASISVYYGGYVKSVDLLPGESVKKGQVLFTLINPEFLTLQESYMETSEALKFAKEDYERQKLLMDDNITSEKKFKKAESEYFSLNARYQSIREQLKLININPKRVEEGKVTSVVTIYAPIAGFVSEVNMNLGMYLQPTDVALEIINTEHIHLELKVYEKDVSQIKEGQDIRFRIPEAENTFMEGTVHVAGKTVRGNERTVDIHGHVNGESLNLIHGMYVEAEINVFSDSVMTLPTQAIIKRGSKSFVSVVSEVINDQTTFHLQEVQIGKTGEERVEIKNWDELSDKKVLLNPEE